MAEEGNGYEFVVPDFLDEADPDTIHQKMMDQLPPDIDKTEGGFPWDFTRPTAIVAAELLQFYAVNIIKLAFPQTSYGVYLDYLGSMVQLSRKPAFSASTYLSITGAPGTAIPSGTIFATEVNNDDTFYEFSSDEVASIGSDGTCRVSVTALVPGTDSNVDANTITVMSTPINGIDSITNHEAATGGAEEEEDDSFRARILAATQASRASYIGNRADFKRWAESVEGVGSATVLFDDEWEGPETVRIVCVDRNGAAANDKICKAVFDYIMAPDNPLERLAPPNVILTVNGPDLKSISYSADIVLEPDFTLDTVKENFHMKLDDFYSTATEEECIKYIDVHALLTETTGVNDFRNLKINGGTKNIPIKKSDYPQTGTITFGEVSE